jgi:Protein of unknown function (DUF3892)
LATYTVTAVRMESSGFGGRHEHIAGVCTSDGVYRTRANVVESLRTGNAWETSAQGSRAKIREVTFCPRPGCLATPYITTDRDPSSADNLENLPRC